MTRIHLAWLLAGLLAAGCAGPALGPAFERGPADAEPAEAEVGDTRPASTRPAPLDSPAVVELSSRAREAMNASRHDEAVQLLERAIRIEPQNGGLWHQLARVRYRQGNYEQARQLATRSNALLSGDSTLKTSNDELIKAARDAQTY